MISEFTSLFAVPVGITGFAMGLKICAVTAENKKYKIKIIIKSQLSREKKKKHDKIVLLEKTKLDTVEIVIDAFIEGFNGLIK